MRLIVFKWKAIVVMNSRDDLEFGFESNKPLNLIQFQMEDACGQAAGSVWIRIARKQNGLGANFPSSPLFNGVIILLHFLWRNI